MEDNKLEEATKVKSGKQILNHGDFTYCGWCNYSGRPNVIYKERKHFDSYRLECSRCLNSTATSNSFDTVLKWWNKDTYVKELPQKG